MSIVSCNHWIYSIQFIAFYHLMTRFIRTLVVLYTPVKEVTTKTPVTSNAARRRKVSQCMEADECSDRSVIDVDESEEKSIEARRGEDMIVQQEQVKENRYKEF